MVPMVMSLVPLALPMVPLATIGKPMVPLAANRTIGNIGKISNGTIGKTPNGAFFSWLLAVRSSFCKDFGNAGF